MSNAHQKHPRGWRILSVGRVLSIHARMPRLGWLIEIRHLSLVTDGGACRPSGSRSCSCQMASSPSLAPSGTSRSTTRHGLCPSSAPMRSMCQSHLAPRESRFEAVVKLWFFYRVERPENLSFFLFSPQLGSSHIDFSSSGKRKIFIPKPVHSLKTHTPKNRRTKQTTGHTLIRTSDPHAHPWQRVQLVLLEGPCPDKLTWG